MTQIGLVILLVCTLTQVVRCNPAERRGGDVIQTFTLAGSTKSLLFAECYADQMSVEGSPCSIAVSETENFVRFAPKEVREFEWKRVQLSQDGDIISCALKASELGAYMFKFSGDCSVSLTGVYDTSDEQDCEPTEQEVVFITDRPFNVFNGVPLAMGEYYDCYLSTEAGVTFGDEEQRLVAETELPERDTCCRHVDKGVCLATTCAEQRMSYCEAKARCEAKGYALASKSLFENLDQIPPYRELSSDAYYYWVGAQLDEENVWRWEEDGSKIENITWSITPQPGEKCALIDLMLQEFGQVRLMSSRCNNNFQPCALCYDPNTGIPDCEWLGLE